MRKLFYCLLFIACCNNSFAQLNHYIYIQAESNQAFYVKLNKKIYSSSVSGYLILPKLVNGTYNLLVGFPKKEWTEQNITCIIADKDQGYLLKNFGDKGWGLFNLQTLDVVMAASTEKVVVVKENKTDEFSNMLADAVNDPTIRQKEPVKEEPKTVVKPAPVVEKEIPQAATVVAAPIVIEPVKVEPAKIKSTITRTEMNSNAEGVEMVYIDSNEGRQDTIRVFIPSEKKAAKSKPAKKEKAEEPKPKEEAKATAKTEPVAQQEKPKEAKFIEMDYPVAATNGTKTDTVQKNAGGGVAAEKPIEKEVVQKEAKPAAQDKNAEKSNKEKKTDSITPAEKPKGKEVANEAIKPPVPNANCKSIATDEDFLKLRKKMAAESTDDEMIDLAKKAFKAKCFSTGQIKNLGFLFLKDDGRYRFFDEAYAFVSDAENFGSLESQLTDPYYTARFKAMIRH